MSDTPTDNLANFDRLPLIALKNTVLFPRLVIPLMVQRAKSVSALEASMTKDRLVMFVTQRHIDDDIATKDMFSIGSIGRVISAFKLPDGSWKIDVEGITRAKVTEFVSQEPYFDVRVDPITIPESSLDSAKDEALMRRVLEQFRSIAQARSFPAVVPEVLYVMSQLKDPEQIIGLVTANLNLDVNEQQRILEMPSYDEALKQLNIFLGRELNVVKAEKDLAKKTKKQIGQMQKEMFLREQLKNIEKELGVEDEREELETIRKRIQEAKMPKDIYEKATKELNRLAKMPPMSPEVGYLRTYLDWRPGTSPAKQK
jgi:ATP-dependent Lon protease